MIWQLLLAHGIFKTKSVRFFYQRDTYAPCGMKAITNT